MNKKINLQMFAECETESKSELQINYSKEMEEIGKSLKSINNNISKLNADNTVHEDDNTIILSSENNNKILVDKNNKKLTDYDVYKRVLKQVKIDKESNKDVPLHPNFVNYMEKYVDYVEKGGKAEDFKKEAIFKEIDISKLKFNKK